MDTSKQGRFKVAGEAAQPHNVVSLGDAMVQVASAVNSKGNSRFPQGSGVDGRVKKAEKPRRHKPIKSCAFCRRRKLKCDHAKPVCSSCMTRGMTVCEYSDQDNPVELTVVSSNGSHSTRHNSNSKGNSSGTPRSVAGSTSSEVDDKVLNPFRNYYYVQSKPNGRTIAYGPTSLRTFIMRNNWGFKEKYMQLWQKIKVDRNIWKKKNLTNRHNELDLMDLEVPNSVSILGDILPCLPDYDTIRGHIEDFFDEKNSNLYEMNTILDKKKILRDLEFGFIQDRHGTIIKLTSTVKKNYYKIGVILMILIFTRFRSNMPLQMMRLFIYLTGLVSPKTSYVEKTQFLMLRCFMEATYATKGDETSVIGLVTELTTSSRALGLHLDIREIYEDKEAIVGSVESLENLWTWVLFFDFELSLRIGKPLDVGLLEFNDINVKQDDAFSVFGNTMNDVFGLNKTDTSEEFKLIPPNLDSVLPAAKSFGDNETKTSNSPPQPTPRDFTKDQTFFGKMRRFLYLVRPMVGEFHKKTGTPKVVEHGQALLKFLEEEFKPIKYATDPDFINELTFGEIRIMLTILDIITIFYSVGFVLLNHRSLILKNISIQTHLLTFSIFKNFVNHCHKLDQKYFPEMVHPSYHALPPYLSTCLSMTLHPVLQSLGIFYAFFFLKATLFENGIFVSNDMVEVDWDISGYNVPTDKSISLITTFEAYRKIFEDWISYEKANVEGFELKNLMLRSYSGLILISLERTYRIIVEKALEYRKKTEKSWMSSHCPPLNNLSTPNTPNLKPVVVDVADDKVEVDCEAEGMDVFQQRERLKYQSYLQYQVQMEQQEQINRLKEHIDGRRQQEMNSNSLNVPERSQSSDTLTSMALLEREPTIISSTGERIKANEMELAQKLVDEFWLSYNTGWEELLNEPSQLFQDLEPNSDV